MPCTWLQESLSQLCRMRLRTRHVLFTGGQGPDGQMRGLNTRAGVPLPRTQSTFKFKCADM